MRLFASFKKSAWSLDDMKDTLSNIMQLCCFVLTIITGLLGTVPRDELTEGNYRAALVSRPSFRQFVAWHLGQRVPPFNFTKEFADGTTFDVKEVLNDPQEITPWHHSNHEIVKRANWAFYMTKDDVEPWVVSVAEKIMFPEGGQSSDFLMECYIASLTITTTCLLGSFFLYMALSLGSFRTKEEGLEDAQKKELQLKVDKQLKRVEWLVYAMSIVLMLAMSVGIVLGFIGILSLGQCRSTDIRSWNVKASQWWACGITALVVLILSSSWLHVYVAKIG